ncbi:MAG: DUF885 domain-containing protein, partial [Thermoanaerobaculia bacterium]|nr:DUF885 domain-containing protein [Thermoanaerobaculia bacterium]
MNPTPPAEATSVERSDQLLQPTFEMLAHFEPELLGRHGYPDLDEEVTTLSPEHNAERIAAHEGELRRLERLRHDESDPEIHLDLEIASHVLTLDLEKLRFEAEHSLPYLDPLGVVFQGLEALLLVPVEPHRRRAASPGYDATPGSKPAPLRSPSK